MHKFISIFALVAMATLGACANDRPDGEPSGVEAAFGLHVDDDGCPGSWGCKAVADGAGARAAAPVDIAPLEHCMGARCRMGGVDPWSAESIAANGPPPSGVIVGPYDLTNPNFSCHSFSTGVEAQADTVVRYVKGDDHAKVCTGLLVTHDGKVLVPTACQSADSTKPSTATFGVYPSVFGCAPAGVPLAGDTYPVTTEALSVDVALGLMVAQLGVNANGDPPFGNHFSVRLNQPAKWPLTASANLTDELIGSATQRVYTLADDACQMATGFLGGIGTTDCDSESVQIGGAPGAPGIAERAFGGLIVWDFNNCVIAGGVCAPGTGPQSPGGFPGRLVGVHYLPSTTSANNRVVSLDRLTTTNPRAPQGILVPYLTPGNFTP